MAVITNALGLEEFKALREEIAQRIQRKFQITGGYVSLALGLCAFALTETAPEALILAPITVAVGLTLIMFEDRHIRLLSAYIEVFYEDPQQGPRWEIALHSQRERKRGVHSFLLWFTGRALVPLAPLASSCAAWDRTDAWSQLPWPWQVAMAVALIICLAAIWQSSLAYSGSKVALTVVNWRRLKDKWDAGTADTRA